MDLKKDAKLSTISVEMEMKIEERILQIEEEVGNEISENHVKEIVETLRKSGGGDDQNLNGFGRKMLWKLLKRKYPKCSPAVPVGEKDKAGNLVTNHEGLKQLYLKTYTHRLRNRPMKEELKELKAFKEELFETRMNLATNKKSEP